MFGVVYVSLIVIYGIIEALKDHNFSFPSGLGLLLLFSVFAAVSIALAIVVYLGAIVWAWSFDKYEIKGRSYWGRRISMRWSDVTSVANTSIEGVPALLIGSKSSNRAIFAYTLGIDLKLVYSQLLRNAGPDHLLTQCFRQD